MNKPQPIIIVSFPKSGTHLLTQMCRPLGEPHKLKLGTIGEKPVRYLATHNNGGWGPKYRKPEVVLDDLKLLQPGQYGGAHFAVYRNIVQHMMDNEYPVIFLYRDLRDVAVSETYHIEEEGDNRQHPMKKKFNKLPTHEDRIRAVIEGADGWLPLRFRWEEYAAWLHMDWVLPVKFRDARLEPELTATAILGYLTWRTGTVWDKELIEHMVGSITPELSPTFRAGRVGDWKREFGPGLRDLAERELGEWTSELGFDD